MQQIVAALLWIRVVTRQESFNLQIYIGIFTEIKRLKYALNVINKWKKTIKIWSFRLSESKTDALSTKLTGRKKLNTFLRPKLTKVIVTSEKKDLTVCRNSHKFINQIFIYYLYTYAWDWSSLGWYINSHWNH